jgi:hypothetical protein
MGYTGLEKIADSDNASDLAHNVFAAAAKELAKGLKEIDNGFNTDGYVNVALIFEACFCNVDDPCVYTNDKLRRIAYRAEKALLKRIAQIPKEDWDCRTNKVYHLTSLKRMAKNLRKFLEQS